MERNQSTEYSSGKILQFQNKKQSNTSLFYSYIRIFLALL